jgi:hypothetical protein
MPPKATRDQAIEFGQPLVLSKPDWQKIAPTVLADKVRELACSTAAGEPAALGTFRLRTFRGTQDRMRNPQEMIDLHASGREERSRRAKQGMRVSGRSARLLARLHGSKRKRNHGKRARR